MSRPSLSPYWCNQMRVDRRGHTHVEAEDADGGVRNGRPDHEGEDVGHRGDRDGDGRVLVRPFHPAWNVGLLVVRGPPCPEEHEGSV